MPLEYCVYVLYSLKDDHLYTGFTTDLDRRFAEHQAGSSASTAPRRPFRLLFCEQYLSKEDALRREKFLKTTSGKRTIRLMLKDSLRMVSSPSSAENK